MSKFDAIRPFNDSEVNEVLYSLLHHPMMKAMMNFTFPDKPENVWQEELTKTQSLRDFQINFVYQSIQRVLEQTSDGLSTSGFEKLEADTPYLFISNHRDIILDTSLLNVCLHDYGLVMTASAIGDNLIQKDFLLKLSRLNRNFIIQRGLSPRELLQSSKLVSEYIYELISKDKRSVWVAQREGRTKDGNDATHQGVLKMIAMASDEKDTMDYFKKLKIVPVSISYEYDPTDVLKIPQLLAQVRNSVYKKEKNEDFVNLLTGVMGQKKHIHIHIGDVLNTELDAIKAETENSNKQIQALAQVIDDSILQSYNLWATNYIAFDLLNNTNRFADRYTEAEKHLFERRMEIRVDFDNEEIRRAILGMYANPVINKMKYADAVW